MNTSELLKMAINEGLIDGYAIGFDYIEIGATKLFFENKGRNTLFSNEDELKEELNKVLNTKTKNRG